MNSLSVWTYYLNNKRKIIPVIVIVIVSIVGLITPPALFKSVMQDVEDGIGIYHNYNTSYYNGSGSNKITKDELLSKLQNSPYVDHVVEAQVRYTQRYAISSDIDTPVYFLNESDYQKVLDQFGLKLIDGRLPQKNTNEVILTSKLAKNKNLVIGSKFGKSLDPNDTIPGEYQLSGLIDSDTVSLGIGNLDFVNQKGSLITFFLIAPKLNSEKALSGLLDQMKAEYPTLSFDTYYSLKNRLDYSYRSLDLVFNIILIIIVTVISTSIGLLQIIFFMQRANEFGLLAAIGYSRWFVIRKSIVEVSVMIALSWILGLIVTYVVFMLLNQYIYLPKAYLPLSLLDPSVLIYSIPVPFVISAFSLIPIIWQLVRMDPVSIIERRD